MIQSSNKETARARVAELTSAFKENEGDYLHSGYNETQARTDFITPLLAAFGWDVYNDRRQSLALREVVEEATVEVGEERLSKRPDYELRLARQRKLFVEAKKPSVSIDRDRQAAFQTRRYGYSASLPISVLTNFHQLAVYDCKHAAISTEDAHVARFMLVGYESFDEKFDDLWSVLSREVVYSGEFDRQFSVDTTRRGADQFDDVFLSQMRRWRTQLAEDIHANTPDLAVEDLSNVVQRFLSRIVFLRICEDRELENYETLKDINDNSKFDGLIELLRYADSFYDSGLFRLTDDEQLNISISNETLNTIIDELYYPQSPYTFAVVESEVLGEIYEQFLGEQISVINEVISIERKPDVVASIGVVPTPSLIAEAVVARALIPAITNKSPSDLVGFTVADICCGSGVFLIAAYSILLDHYLSWYLENDSTGSTRVCEVASDSWRLTYEEKRRILLNHIRGVDIDSKAVEITQFSLLLKLLQDEHPDSLKDFTEKTGETALPNLDTIIRCGNSLVSDSEWQEANGPLISSLRASINPFTWGDEFPEDMSTGGFNVIVGNPPYIRIQHMKQYSPREVEYYQHTSSPFSTAQRTNFDKYVLFIERALTLVKKTGRVGMIVPHKFMTIQSGRLLRLLLTSGNYVEEIVHFGVKKVFGQETSNYTCILVLDAQGRDELQIETAGPLEKWRYGHIGETQRIPASSLGEEPWAFVSERTNALFIRTRRLHTKTLSDVSDINVGLQTSSDSIYIIHPVSVDENYVHFSHSDRDWQIERGMLRPCLHDVILEEPYTKPKANAWIIFPYEYTVDENDRTRAHLIQPERFQTEFPLCWSYLNANKEALLKRNISGGQSVEQQWYQYGRSQSLTKFDTPKIVLPVLSTEQRYGYDDENVLFTGGGNGPYYMIRPSLNSEVSIYYLLAVLNHPFSEALIRSTTSVFRGGYYSHGRQFITNLPVPIPELGRQQEIERKVLELIQTLEEIKNLHGFHDTNLIRRQAVQLRRDIESMMSVLLALNEEEMELVLSVPIPD